MAVVKITYAGNTDLSQVYIDDVLALNGTGTTTRDIPDDDADHSLTWFVRGQPGSGYDLQITQPTPAVFGHRARIDSSTKDAGLHWFRVTAEGGGE